MGQSWAAASGDDQKKCHERFDSYLPLQRLLDACQLKTLTAGGMKDLARMRGVIACSSEVRRRPVRVCTFLVRAVDPAGIGPQEVARAVFANKRKCLDCIEGKMHGNMLSRL